MSEQSLDAGCSAGLPVISSRRMTPKLYTSMKFVGCLVKFCSAFRRTEENFS
jgi:hypothetical protein